MNRKKKVLSCLLALFLLLSLAQGAFAANKSVLQEQVAQSAAYLTSAVPVPQFGSVGGEWAVLGLARSGCAVPSGYFEDYYARIEQTVQKKSGVLSERKYTDYSRLILALTAIGKDARNVAGYDLTQPLGDFEKTVWQGVNGPIWALIALDCGSYPMPQSSASRQKYVDKILFQQLKDGGWSLSGREADIDVTGMALQALSKYQKQKDVAAATEKALSCLSKAQNDAGGYASCESTAQVLVALCELGVSLTDFRFVKNGKTVLDGLLGFRLKDGSFTHTLEAGSGNDLMSTEQGFYALAAALRAANAQSSLYRMGEVKASDAAFSDISGSAYKTAIEKLAADGIINGMGNGKFMPDKTMTRAEFTAIVVRALGLTPKANGKFTDVPADKWFAPYIGTASANGIVNGVSQTLFKPNGTISRQEAACMVCRAAKHLGKATAMDASDVKTALSRFSDGNTVSDWAKSDVAFCLQSGILPVSGKLSPMQAIHWDEIAQMIYKLLNMQ